MGTEQKDSQESIRLFKNPAFEALTHIHPATPFVIFMPVVFAFLFKGLQRHGVTLSFSLTLVGLLSWTLLEYILHRFVFHFTGSGKVLETVHFFIHGIHHDAPKDATRLVMPLPVSVPLAFFFYFLFRNLFFPYHDPVFAGLVLGYLAYDFLHYAFHHLPLKGRVLTFLKQYHLQHHYNDQTKGFGVSNPLWDYIFRTTF